MSYYSQLPFEELNDIVARNPEEVDLRLALVEHYVRKENYVDALAHAEMAEDLVEDKHPEVEVWKSLCLIFNGDLELGHEQLQRVVRNNPCTEFQLRLVTEIVPLFTGEQGESMTIDWLDLTGDERTDLPDEFLDRANSFIDCVNCLQEDADGGIQSLVNHIAEFPEDINARLYLAIAYCGANELEAAAAVYQQVIELDEECATAYFDLAALVSDPDEAIALTEKGLEYCPFAKHARYNLGMFLIRKGDYAAARRELTRIPADSSVYTEALVATGMAFEEEFDIPGAVECLEKAVALRPDRADIRGKYGQLLCDCGLYEEAMQEIDAAIEMDSNQFCVWANKGLLHLQADETDEALHALQRSLELNPRSEDAAINLAVLLAESGDIPQGIEILNEAAIHHPENALVFQNLGALHCNLKQLDKALEHTERAIELGIDTPAIFWNLANIYCFQDQREECLANLGRAIEGDPSFAEQFQQDEDFQKYWDDPDFLKIVSQ